MKFAHKQPIIIDIIAAVFVLLFLYTALSKLNDPDQFIFVIQKSPLIGEKADYLATIIPGLEILTAIALIVPSWRRIGLISTIVLMSLFTAYITYMLLFASSLPCSCGGVLKELSWSEHLIFNISLTILAIYALWLFNRNKKLLIATGKAENLQKRVGANIH